MSSRLGRPDLTPGKREMVLEAGSCRVIRPVLRQQWETGTFHPKEEVIVQETLSAVLASSSSRRSEVAEELLDLGLEPAIPAEELPVQRLQATAVSLLVNPNATVEQVSAKLRLMVIALTLYYWNVPLARLGQWFGGSPSTVFTWVTGVAVAVYPTWSR